MMKQHVLVEMALTLGAVIANSEKEVDSDVFNFDTAHEVIEKWAIEFAETYGFNLAPTAYTEFPELNVEHESFGLIAALDAFVKIKFPSICVKPKLEGESTGMTVWVVQNSYGHDENNFDSVWSTEELAEARAKELEKNGGGKTWVSKEKVDDKD